MNFLAVIQDRRVKVLLKIHFTNVYDLFGPLGHYTKIHMHILI